MKQRVAWCLSACLLSVLLAEPLCAQVNLGGNWALQNQQDFSDSHAGPFPADFTGVPLNKEGRASALSWEATTLEELNRQCEPWAQHYLVEYGGPPARPAPGGTTGIIIYSTTDPVSGVVNAWHINGSTDRMPVDIWVNGHAPPPPNALHTFGGFTSGTWRGDTLVAVTDHIKDGFLTRNGVPNSNREVITLFITRHEDMLTITGVIRDPVYLTDAYSLAQTYKINLAGPSDTPPMTCDPAETIPGFSDGYHSARVLPSSNPLVTYMQEHYNIPPDAAMGGAETMFPEFRKRLAGRYTAPKHYCTQYCCGAMGTATEALGASGRYDHTVLKCSEDGY